ncbi:MAG: FG-GAP-like repeat-containing protein [Cyanobacteria bacterium P01_G01_bin.54]
MFCKKDKFGKNKNSATARRRRNTFVLEPILTPMGVIPADLEDSSIGTDPIPVPEGIDSPLPEILDPSTPNYESGVFVVGESGQVSIDFLFDGGFYDRGEVGIFSLAGLDPETLSPEEFAQAAAQRALSGTEGHVVISDATDGARFSGTGWREPDFNAGDYQGVQTFQMEAGTEFGIMLVPNQSIQAVANGTAWHTPLFSMHTENPNDALHFGQIADVTGDGNTFVMEDVTLERSDQDYNDMVFQIRGATAVTDIPEVDELVAEDRDWREFEMGQALIDYADAYTNGTEYTATDFAAAQEHQPLVGIIDTGFAGDNPDIDYSNITTGSDFIDGDDNPFLTAGEGNEHGTHILGIIAAEQGNDIGIDGINDDAPIWLGRAVGSGRWADSLIEFVDAARESGQPNAVVNLSMDLTQIDADGNLKTRYEFTPLEMAALEYARQNNVLVAVAAGNEGSIMSALGQASEQFDNIITVGAAERIDGDASNWQGFDRADYSSYGQGLDIMANGGTAENPISTVAGSEFGSSIATAQVTGAASNVWAANPDLSYRQVIEILKSTATDLKTHDFDAETGVGLLNIAAAIQLAKATQPEDYEPELEFVPTEWGGEGEVTPSERAAAPTYQGYTFTGVTQPTSWTNFLNIFGSRSQAWQNFIKRIFDKFYLIRRPRSSQVTLGQKVDFNGDGKADFFRQEKGGWDDDQVNTANTFLGTGHGTFQKHTLPEEFDLKGDLTNLYMGDFNGDGKTDILRQEKGHWDNDKYRTTEILFSNGNGSFRKSTLSESLDLKSDDGVNIHIGDFNGDGKTDILRQEKGGWDNDKYRTAEILFSQGSGSFNKVTLSESFHLSADNGTILHMGDFNGDGKTDFLRQEQGNWDNDYINTANVFLSKGNGDFQKVNLPEEFRLNADNGANLHMGDFNGDGKTDFLRQEKGGWDNDRFNTANVFLSNGTGSFRKYTLPESFDLSADNGTILHMGDFNGDGKTDFLRQEKGHWDDDSINTSGVFISSGNGSFRKYSLPENFDLSANNGTILHMADFNNDGKTDFLRQEKGGWDNDSFNTAGVFMSTGLGQFSRVGVSESFDLSGDNGTHLYTNNERPWEDHENLIVRTDGHNKIFHRGQEWVTPTGYKFVFQQDGNLVLYNPHRKPTWATGTHGTGANVFAVQADGNVVLYDHGRPVWATDTAGHRGSYLAIQNDGNLVVYSAAGKALFDTGTWGGNIKDVNQASRKWLAKQGNNSGDNSNFQKYTDNQVDRHTKLNALGDFKEMAKLMLGNVYFTATGGYLQNYSHLTHYYYGYKAFHAGFDIATANGNSAYALTGGEVIRISYRNSKPIGAYVYNKQLDKTMYYGHVVNLNVSAGQSIVAGQKLGSITDGHLHFDVRGGRKSNWVDPRGSVYSKTNGAMVKASVKSKTLNPMNVFLEAKSKGLTK